MMSIFSRGLDSLITLCGDVENHLDCVVGVLETEPLNHAMYGSLQRLQGCIYMYQKVAVTDTRIVW